MARASDLRSIVTEGERTLDAAQTAAVLTGMRTLAVSTVTASGEPRVSGEDGHFLHARWVFTTSGTAVKARHLRARPAGVGSAHRRRRPAASSATGGPSSSTRPRTRTSRGSRSTWSRHYGSSPRSWGLDIVYLRVQPHWMVSYSFAKDRLLADAD